MQARLPRKYKRFLTEPTQRTQDTPSHKQPSCTLHELRAHVAALGTRNDHTQALYKADAQNFSKNINDLVSGPNRVGIKRHALRKLPELSNLHQTSNGKDTLKNTSFAPLFKRNNPLLIVNTLFQIAKEDVQASASHNLSQHKQKEIDQTVAKSVKVSRGPRIVQNELTRLTQKADLSRRQIWSEGKARPKAQNQEKVQLMTFYRPKEVNKQQDNQFLL